MNSTVTAQETEVLTEVYSLQHPDTLDTVKFTIYLNSGVSYLDSSLVPDLDDCYILAGERGELPVYNPGTWEECNECEADRITARPIYRYLTMEGYLPIS